MIRRADRLVAVARFEVSEYGSEMGIPPEKFALIPNGVDSRIAELARLRAAPSSELITLASIGRLERYKGHHRVIAALPELLRRLPSVRLLVVGSGPYAPNLREQAEALGVSHRVEITSVPAGDVEGMAELLSGVALVTLMSEFETHPLVGLEAAAAGKPLLVAATRGLLELADDGLARAIPLDASPSQFATAALEELHAPMPVAEPSLPDWGDCAARLVGLYDEILEARRGR